MFDELVRVRFERVSAPAARGLARLGVSPTGMTAAAFVVSLAAAAVVGAGWPRLGFALWVLSRVGDGLDGVLARVSNRKTPFGGYLDITLDMTAYSAMVLGFAVLHPAHGLLWAAVLAGYVIAITTTLALASAAERAGRPVSATNRTFQFTSGLAEAGETSFVYGAWVFLPGWVGPLGWLWVGILVMTGVQRSWLAWRTLHEGPSSSAGRAAE